jgi:hypothetical protein
VRQLGRQPDLNADAKSCGSCGAVCQTCETCAGGLCKNACPAGRNCSNGQCCDSKMGQACQSSECQTGTYDCNGTCVFQNKADGTHCGGTSFCPAKICKNGVCEFGGVNSCPTGQVCGNVGGCALSGRRSKASLPDGTPYSVYCQACGTSSATCCEGRVCQAGLTSFTSGGDYCEDCSMPGLCVGNQNNDYCTQYY